MPTDRYSAEFSRPLGEATDQPDIRIEVRPTERTAVFLGAEPFYERAAIDCRVDDFLIQLWWRDELVHLPPSRFVLRRGRERLPEHDVLRPGDVVEFDLDLDSTPRLH